jgi:integrase
MGYPRVELPVDSDPSSPEFQAAYHAALRGEKVADAVNGIKARGGSGSVRSTIEQYLDSATFREFSPGTQALRRSILNSISRIVGHLPLATIKRKWIDSWIESASTKGAGRTRYLALRPFLQWGCETVHLIDANPTDGMKVKAKESEGHATWTDEEIAQFRAHHPLGGMARLAIELVLAVAGRRGDAIALGRQHLKQDQDGEWWLVFTQEKNRKRKPVKVQCPVPAELMAAIEACRGPETSLTFLTNEWGRPFDTKGFNDWFRRQVQAAGLGEHCVPHGLRKAACRIMAESNCTVHEIKSVSGHRTLKEVERYTNAVDNRKLAARARAKVAAANNVVPLREFAG